MSDEYRYEIKFVLQERAFANFLGWMFESTRCRKKYSPRTVNSLYFDDPSFSSVRDNLAGVAERKKIRLRWYSDPSDQDISSPILELKLKSGRLGTKHFVPVKNFPDSLQNLTYSEIHSVIIDTVLGDASLGCLIPTLLVSYRRQYFEDRSGVRITVDEDINFKGRLSMSHTLQRNNFVRYRSKVVEIKFDPALKNIVNDFLRPLRLTPVRHSKYLTGLAMFGEALYL